MTDNYDVELITIIEEYGDTRGLISSEGMLSSFFDTMIEDINAGGIGVEMEDEIALHETFINWADGLRRNGELHQLQYDTYVYVGKIF